jgi:predicted permease
MLYRFGASTPIAQLFDPSVALTYLLCGLVVVGFVMMITLHGPGQGRIGWNDAAFGALVGAFPNTGFMGVPLLVALLGQSAAGTAIVTILVDMVITSSLCIALSRLDAAHLPAGMSGAAAAGQAVRNALKGVATNPMPWSILAGAVVSAFAIELPAPVAKTIGLLADAASPVALFTIGAVLARSQIMAEQDAAHAVPWDEVVPVALVKLFLHPLLVLLVGVSAISLGVPLGKDALTVLVLLAALPSASNVSLLAERFGADNGRIARIILVSTAAAFFTFSGAVGVMVGRV